MKTIKLIAVAFAALAAVSCVKDNMGGADSKTYQASFTDRLPDAKATIAVGQEESLVSWETSDRVGIMYGTSNLEYKADQAGSRSSLSAVSASADAAEVWAMLPYDASATLSSGVINTVLPSEQPAKAGASFHHLAVAHSTSANLAFSNVCGLVRVKVATEGITKVVFAGKSQEKVAGMISITVADCSVTGANAESVALVPAEGAASIPAGDYFLAVLPQTFANGFTVTAYKGSEAVITKEVAGPVELKRSGVFAGTIREVVISALSSYVLTTGETVKISGTGFSAIAEENTVMVGEVSCEVSAASSTELSVVVPSGLEKATDYTFSVSVKGAAAPVASPKFRYYCLPQYEVSVWAGDYTQAMTAGALTTAAQFNFPQDLAWDADGNLWVSHRSGKAVSCIDMTNQTNGSSISVSSAVFGISYGNGALYTSNKDKGKIGVVKNSTHVTFDSEYAFTDIFDVLCGDGKIYAALRGGLKLAVISSDNSVSEISLSIKPYKIAFNEDASGIFIGPNNHNKIVLYDIAAKSETHVAGNGTAPTDGTTIDGAALNALIGQVVGLYCDEDGYLYFSDSSACRFRVLIPGVGGDYSKGIVRTLAGTAIGTDGGHGNVSDHAVGDGLTEAKFGKEGIGGIVKYGNGFLVAGGKRHVIYNITPKTNN